MNASSNITMDSKSKSLVNSINVPAYSYPNISNLAYETPKRTRFSFKPEHLVVSLSFLKGSIYKDEFKLFSDYFDEDSRKIISRKPISRSKKT